MSKVTRFLITLAAFAVYTAGCLYFAFEASGAGHGTLVYFAPLVSWPLLLIVAIAFGISSSSDKFLAMAVLVITHEVLTLGLVSGYVMDGAEAFVKMWNQSTELLVGGICWYVIGQVLFWIALFRSQSPENVH